MNKTALALALALCLIASPVVAERVHWGVEHWALTSGHFKLYFDYPVSISKIEGTVSATGMSPTPDLLREALVTMTAPTSSPPAGVHVSSNGGNTSVDQHLFAMNVKQRDTHEVHVPFKYEFDPPVMLPANALTLVFDPMVFSCPTQGQACTRIYEPADALDIEFHMTVTYTPLLAPAAN